MATTEPIQIPIEAIDNATRVVENFGKNMTTSTQGVTAANKGASLSFTELNSVIGVTKQVYAAVSGVVKDVYGSFSKAAEATRDLALASGTTATEASTLLQVLDDYQISADDVTAASKKMKENGLVPTIETLAKLSDQFLAIKDPAERLQFAQDNLGKSYSKYLNVLQQGGDVLRKNAGEVNQNLVLSDEQIASYEKQRLALDELSDTYEGAKVQLGAWIGEVLIGIKATHDFTSAAKELGIIHDGMNDRMRNSALEAFRGQMERGAAATEYYNKMLDGTAEAAGNTSEAIKDLSAQNAKTIEGAIALQAETEKYNQSQSEILAKISELEAKKAAMYPWEKSAIADINGEIDGLKDQYAAGAAAFEEAQGRKLAMMALEKIALSDGVAGYSAAEMEKAEAILNTAGIAEDSALRQTLAFEKASSAIADSATPAKDLQTILDMMEQGYSIDVAVNYMQNGTPPNMAPGAVGATTGPNAQAQAGGYGYAASGAGNNNKPRARGGPLASGGWTLVGDRPGGQLTPYSELISPWGYVYDAKTSKWLLDSGLVQIDKALAQSGDLYESGGRSVPYIPSKPPITTTAKRGGASASIASTDSAAVSEQINAAVEAVSTSAASIQTTQQAVAQQTQAMTTALNSKIDELISVMTGANPRAIGAEVGYQLAKAS